MALYCDCYSVFIIPLYFMFRWLTFKLVIKCSMVLLWSDTFRLVMKGCLNCGVLVEHVVLSYLRICAAATGKTFLTVLLGGRLLSHESLPH